MTIEDTRLDRDQVLRRVELIAEHAADDMAAAQLERELHADFVRAIAAGTLEGSIEQVARDILAAHDLEFYRW